MKVESNLPIPSANGGKTKYPIRTMKPGESFLAEGQKMGGGAYSSAWTHGRLTGKEFTGRTVEGGVRIWRIK